MKTSYNFQISYDYALVLIANEGAETLIGGAEKILNRAFKDEKNPNLDIKGLDVYYEGEQLGTLALDVRVTREADKIRELIDKLYANLTGKGTNSRKVEETLNDLDVMFKVDKSPAVRVLARTIYKWYEAATDLYMNARLGLGLKQADRAALGEQFREYANALITEMFADLKKKNPPQSAEDSGIIRFSAAEIGEFLAAYSRYLAAHKAFCIECKLCGEFFLSAAHNSLYCADCKLVRKKGSKAAFREKSSDELRKARQTLKYTMENMIYKSKRFAALPDDVKAAYKALRADFIAKSGELLKDYEKSHGGISKKKLNDLLEDAQKAHNKFVVEHLGE